MESGMKGPGGFRKHGQRAYNEDAGNFAQDRRSFEVRILTRDVTQIGYGSNRKTRHMMPSGHKAFLVNNTRDLDLLLMHNRTYAAEIAHAVSARKRVEIVARAKQLGVKVTNSKAKIATES
ncbi:hypothetical protein D0861_04334 [Hortaea werneckii]|uniref:Ribosomal protein L32e n=1 Tax=Hortaea werneckii TaxID=91943 RepID=A0A3M7FKU4_HORWE|nr:hypothetical protein D0861_04334 [Hortaea werneckii]